MIYLGQYGDGKDETRDLRLDFAFNLRRIDTRTRMRVILRLLDHKEEEGLVLVCGCGVGVECKVLGDQCKNVVGLDVNRRAIKVASSNVPDVSFVVGSATKLPFRDESFSRIVCSAVLEHIPDDKNVILEMQRTLKTGKELAITVPLRKHLESDARFLKQVEKKFGHVREGYTINDIKTLIHGGKLNISKVKLYWGPFHSLMLKLFEITPHVTKNSLVQAINPHEAKTIRRILRTQAWHAIILLLTVVSYIDDLIPLPASYRSGLGILMKKVEM